jgi:hypothetical protein
VGACTRSRELTDLAWPLWFEPKRVPVPCSIVRRVRVACAHLPEAYEEQPFDEVRWRIRGRTLADLETRVGRIGTRTCVTFHAERSVTR